MRATRLMFVLLLSSSLLAPPASLAKGKGHDQGRGGKDRVERVEKDRGEKRGKGERAKKARAERERGEKAREVRQVRERRQAQLREQREVRLREQRRAELRQQRRQAELRLHERERDRLHHLVARMRDGWNDDDRDDRRLRSRVRVVRREVRLDPIFTFRSDPFGRRVVLPPRPLVTRVDQAFLVAPRFQPVRTVRRVVPRNDVTVIDLGLDLDDRFGLLALPVTLALANALVDDVDVVVRSGRFAAFDSDLDGYVTPVEWPAGRRSFRSYDRDDDLLLVRDELYVDDDLLVVDRDRLLLFHGLDRDDDGLIAPWEWPGDLDSFFLRDFDGDAVISLDELMGLVEVDYGVRDYRYDALDFDRDGRVARVEWVGDPVRFTRLDRNADGAVGRWEYGVGWVLDV